MKENHQTEQEDPNFEKGNKTPIMELRPPDRLPGFRMTTRDVAILKAVYTHRLLTTAQIVDLLFPPEKGQRHQTKVSRARHRLKMLKRLGYLHQDEQPIRLKDGRKPYLYMLAKKALPLLAREYDVLQEDISWKPRDNQLAWRYLEHLMATNDVRIAIEIAARRNGYLLNRWLDERTLKSQEMKDSVEIQGSGGRVAVVPDGYFHLTVGQYSYHHMMEIDMGTETGLSDKYNRRTFSGKIQAYLAYYVSGKYESRYGTSVMRVLTVTTGPGRMKNLKKIAERLGGGEEFWFVTFDKVTPETVLTEPVWSVAGQDELRPLIW